MTQGRPPKSVETDEGFKKFYRNFCKPFKTKETSKKIHCIFFNTKIGIEFCGGPKICDDLNIYINVDFIDQRESSKLVLAFCKT